MNSIVISTLLIMMGTINNLMVQDQTQANADRAGQILGVTDPIELTFIIFHTQFNQLQPKKAIVNAKVSVKSNAWSKTTRTNSSGKAVFKYVPNAMYKIEVSKKGCKTYYGVLKNPFAKKDLTIELTCK